MIKKIILILMFFDISSFLHAMKNNISEELHYTNHALERMKERSVTSEEVIYVLQTGRRIWDLENRDAEKFVDRKNKSNPLIVVLNRKEQPHTVVTIYKGNTTTIPTKIRRLTLREEEYLSNEKKKKAKDLHRERKAKK